MRAQLFAITDSIPNRERLAVTARECDYDAPATPTTPTPFVVCAECITYGESRKGLRGAHHADARALRGVELSAAQCCLCGEAS